MNGFSIETATICYGVMSEEEMTYVEGGALNTWQKALVISGIALAGIGLCVALAYGQVWLASSIAKKAFSTTLKTLMKKQASACIALIGTFITTSLGISATATTAAITAVINYL